MAAKRRRKSRRNSRRRSRNVWAVKGSRAKVNLTWKKRKRKSKKTRGGRKGRKGRKGRRARRRNTGAVSSSSKLSISRPLQAITAGFNVNALSRAAVITAGVLGNAALSGAVSNLLPVDFLKRGPGSYATGLATAGLLGAGVGMIAPKYAGDVFFGGVLSEVTRAIKEYILPMLPMRGLDDYLTPQNAASATPLGYLNDYLTPANAAAAIPLHGLSGDDTVSEELAVFG